MSPTVGRTTRHTYLLMVRILIGGEEVETIFDSGGSPPQIASRIATKFRVWKMAQKVKVWHDDGFHFCGRKYVGNTLFSVFSDRGLLGRFALDS